MSTNSSITTTSWRHHSSPTNSSSLLPPHIKCHWYHHDHDIGTQVLVVSSQVLDYVALVFAGTDDLKSLLTDGDILMRSFGLIHDDDDDDTTATLFITHQCQNPICSRTHGLLQVKLMQQIQTQVEQAMIQLHQVKQQNPQEEEREQKRGLRRGIPPDDDYDEEGK
jgi:hypothetical protein